MTKAELKRRMAALVNKYTPEAKSISIRVLVMDFVPADDPRCGSWMVEEREASSAAAMDAVRFFCADLEHFTRMRAQFDQQEDELLFTVSEPRGPIFTTNVNPTRK